LTPVRKLFWTLAALFATSVLLFLLAPRAPLRLSAAGWDDLAARTVAGAYHIHSTRSDGHADRSGIAAAAARAGLAFIILTDHGDATRPPDPPAYLEGVLVLDAVEVSTDDGHYVAIDMPRAPYPLGGGADAVVDDVRRLGGFGIAAHPDSPKPALRWTGRGIPDGIEWLNLDSEWRDETRSRLLRAGLAYFIRPGPALASLLDRPPTIARWGRLTGVRPVVALAAVDAHGGVGRRAEDASRNVAGTVGIPSYAASFQTFSNRVVLDGPLSGDAAADARAIYTAIRKGRVFTSVDAVAGPALLDFAAQRGTERSPMGSVLQPEGAATLVARALVPPGAELTIVHHANGVVASTRGGELRYDVPGPGAYHVEIGAPGMAGEPRAPWVLSNPIYFQTSTADDSAAPVNVAPAPSPAIAPFPWRIEKDGASSAVVRTTGAEVALEYTLGGGGRAGQFVALASDLRAQAFGGVDLALRSDRPMRVSVQLRTADGTRWGRSYYVDPAGSAIHVAVAELAPMGGRPSGAPLTSMDATSLLLVVDLTNAEPGRAGALRVLSSALAR
jgi:hypothetical protein